MRDVNVIFHAIEIRIAIRTDGSHLVSHFIHFHVTFHFRCRLFARDCTTYLNVALNITPVHLESTKHVAANTSQMNAGCRVSLRDEQTTPRTVTKIRYINFIYIYIYIYIYTHTYIYIYIYIYI